MRWAFFVDAKDDILPYVSREELIVVTADVKNFAAFDESRHEGVFFLDDQQASAYRIAEAVLEIVNQYGSPDHMNGKIENLDQWISDERSLGSDSVHNRCVTLHGSSGIHQTVTGSEAEPLV